MEGFLEYIYLEAITIKRAYDCVSALVYMFPKRSGDLKIARKMIKLWQSEEPPERPVALTPESVPGMAGIAVALKLPGVCACLLIGFDGFLRTGELFSLTVGAITFAGEAAIITLDNTKSLSRALQDNTFVVSACN